MTDDDAFRVITRRQAGIALALLCVYALAFLTY